LWWRRDISADLGWQLETLGEGKFGLGDDLIDLLFLARIKEGPRKIKSFLPDGTVTLFDLGNWYEVIWLAQGTRVSDKLLTDLELKDSLAN
jgi:hypothetical protein